MPQLNTSELDNAIQELGSSLSNIINRALTVEDMRMQSLSSVEFQAQGDSGIYGKGLHWKGDGPTRQFIYRANPDRIFSTESIDLDRNATYLIGNAPVLTLTTLGPSITTSSLSKVGTLNNLHTQGDLVIDEEIFYSSTSGRLGLGTEAPNGKFSLATLDAEFIIDTAPGVVKAGTWTSDDFSLITDNTTRLTVQSNGNIELGNSSKNISVTVHGKLGVGVNNMDSDVSLATAGAVKFDNKKFMNSNEIPTSGTFRKGDIVWNTNTIPTGYVGWVCVREGTPGEWKPFGQIGS
jgi:hypothetical protein